MSRRPDFITCDTARFDSICGELAARVQSTGTPDVVVGIARGGEKVAHAIAEHLPDRTGVVIITIQRRSTELKDRFPAGRLLGLLPEQATNYLRWLEVEWREATHFRRDRRPAASLDFKDAEAVMSRLKTAGDILIVDDTVDSGDTLQHACGFVRSHSNAASIRTAVITSTWRRPQFVPTIALYERTLVRFPWSMDASV